MHPAGGMRRDSQRFTVRDPTRARARTGGSAAHPSIPRPLHVRPPRLQRSTVDAAQVCARAKGADLTPCDAPDGSAPHRTVHPAFTARTHMPLSPLRAAS
ncbi:hypothetical protein GCM10022232_52480 [Streptomyces plumbiresistens]|uniref:Uncharacterized protein n=1 Tax=Streptomyces plumbiresistens TaxID=511811 RepID=A0ABP7S3U8_9ACTN